MTAKKAKAVEERRLPVSSSKYTNVRHLDGVIPGVVYILIG
jgi:hypothetical protein